MLRRGVTLAVILLVVMGLLIGCGDGGSQKTGSGKEPYKIGAVLDISGKSSSLGIPERDTIQMVVNQINEKGGINGHPIELIMLDTKSNETEAALAVRKLIQQDVLAVIGASTSGSTMAMVDAVQKAQLPLVSCAASINIVEPVSERKWVFKTAQSDSIVSEKIIEYLQDQGLRKVAFISVNNAYGDSGRIEFMKAAKSGGIEIVAEEKFEQDDTIMTSQLASIKKVNPDAVVAWAIPPAASSLTVNYKQMGLEMPLIHSHGIGNQTFIELAGDSANGVIFPIGKLLIADRLADSDPQKAVLADYKAQYEEKYGPTNPFGGYAWDAIQLVVKAIEKAGPDKAKIRTEIENQRDFVGVTGIFSMSPTEHNGLTKDDLILVRINKGTWEIVP